MTFGKLPPHRVSSVIDYTASGVVKLFTNAGLKLAELRDQKTSGMEFELIRNEGN